MQSSVGRVTREQYTETLAFVEQVVTLYPSIDMPSAIWNSLCWNGALWGHHKAVAKGACERAVEGEPSRDVGTKNKNLGVVDSRGLARALVGDLTGAASDFQTAVDWASEHSKRNEQWLAKRRGWIKRSREDENPFDEELLEELDTRQTVRPVSSLIR